jgi:hypothetical protein
MFSLNRDCIIRSSSRHWQGGYPRLHFAPAEKARSQGLDNHDYSKLGTEALNMFEQGQSDLSNLPVNRCTIFRLELNGFAR